MNRPSFRILGMIGCKILAARKHQDSDGSESTASMSSSESVDIATLAIVARCGGRKPQVEQLVEVKLSMF